VDSGGSGAQDARLPPKGRHDVQLDLPLLASFALLWLAIVPTPGPNTLLIVHLALTAPVRDVALALLGNLLAIAFYALTALIGVTLLLAAAPSVRLGVYLAGGAYLLRAGISLAAAGRRRLATGDTADPPAPPEPPGAPFRQGVLTALANVQALFFLTSIFITAGVLSANPPTKLAAVATILVLNGTYLAFIAWLLQRPRPRALFARYRPLMEIAFGALFVAFGVRLIAREVGPWL
jgi:threonine/homoserine/homoserine lactone efflux protein